MTKNKTLNQNEWLTTIADMIGVAFSSQFKEDKVLSKSDLCDIVTTVININNKFVEEGSATYNSIKKELVTQLSSYQEEYD